MFNLILKCIVLSILINILSINTVSCTYFIGCLIQLPMTTSLTYKYSTETSNTHNAHCRSSQSDKFGTKIIALGHVISVFNIATSLSFRYFEIFAKQLNIEPKYNNHIFNITIKNKLGCDFYNATTKEQF